MSTTSQVSAGVQGSTRHDFLDWLRVMAIFVLLFFHTGMLFVGWWWHIQNERTIELLVWPMDIAHRLRMPLLFVIAGAGMWFALNRRSALQVIRERSLRLLLPLVAGMLLIVPPQVYFERLFQGEWQGGYLAFLVERVFEFQPYPQGDFSWHHLWFIAYLYVYVLILLPLLYWWKRNGTALKPGVWLYGLALPLGINEALLRPLFPESHNLVADWYIFNHYLLLTVYGFLLASMPGSWDWLAAQRRRILGWGIALSVVAITLYEHDVIERNTAPDSLVATVFTWSWLMVFLAYGRRYLSFENGLIRWARDASYPVYILHQTIIVAIGYFIVRQPWTPWTKFAIVVTCTLVSCVLLYELCIRSFALARLIFGMKPQATAPMSGETSACRAVGSKL